MTCRMVVVQYSQGIFTRSVNLFDHSTLLTPLRPQTRLSPSCDCLICEIGRSNLNPLHHSNSLPAKLPAKRPAGRPRSAPCRKENPTPFSTPSQIPTAVTICSFCFTALARGKGHNCTKGTRNENLRDMTAHGSPKTAEKLASFILKEKAEEAKENKFALSTSTGRPIHVLLGADNKSKLLGKSSTEFFTADDISNIQLDLNLSTNGTLRLARHIRTATLNRKSIEVNLRQKLSAMNHAMDDYFTVTHFNAVGNACSAPSSQVTPVVFCDNVDGFIGDILNERDLTPDALQFKVGIDGGGGFLKICLNIFENNNTFEENGVRSSYKDGIAAKRMKLTSVKKLFILAIAPDVEENYENVLSLWKLLHIQESLAPKGMTRIASDLKLTNILLGLMSHASCHPCSWCDVHKTRLNEKGEMRTLGNLREKFDLWTNVGADPKKAKFFGNVTHIPIINGNPHLRVIDILPPPQLHLLLGPVNIMFKGLLKEWQDALQWARLCNVERDAIHGGSFNGNACHILLSKLDLLQSMCPLSCLPYVVAFQSFRNVVDACYGHSLQSNYLDILATFQENYTDLNINITPKIHAVFFHVADFCKQFGLGLGLHSEQASEAVHADFKSTWQKFKVVPCHPNYSHQLLRAVREYNSKHV